MIKNLIFDVGDVIIEYRWQDLMTKDLGYEEEAAARAGAAAFYDPMWNKLDRGVVSLAEAREYYLANYPEEGPMIAGLLDHPELMHVTRPEVCERIKLLHQAGYNIYLLSNYSKELFDVHMGGQQVLNEVDGMVVSYQVKLLKPEPEIYKALLEKYELEARESIFFDDRIENVKGAEAVGMYAFHVEGEQQLLAKLSEF